MFSKMRIVLISLIVIMLQGMLNAQSLIEIMIDTVYTSGTNVDAEIIGYNNIVNLTEDTLTIKWERVEADYLSGWESSFCDAYSCFPTNVNSSSFKFYPRDTSRMDLHLYSLGKTGSGNAYVELSLEETGQLLGVLYYYFEVDEFSTTDNIALDCELLIYPQPTTDFFRLKHNDLYSRVEIIDFKGRKIKTYQVLSDTRVEYEIGNLAPGMYLLRIIDKMGRLKGTQQFLKM